MTFICIVIKENFISVQIDAFVTLRTLRNGKISQDVRTALSCEITITVLTNNVCYL